MHRPGTTTHASDLQDHTNENFPSNLRVARKGDRLILQTRTATLVLFAEQWKDVVSAITEVSQ